MLRRDGLLKLFFWIVLFESIGFLLGLLTQANLYPWYAHLNKSVLTPPGYVFSIVWSLLYLLLAVVGWLLFNRLQPSIKKIKLLFSLQMLMNWLWTPLFFGLHLLTVSMVWLVFLTFLNMLLIIKACKEHKIIAWLLTPYALWLMYASYLNGVIALTN